MSEAIHFDTHKFVKRMTESGMTEPTAEALADEQMKLIQGELATKQNLAIVHRDIEELRKETKQSIEELRKETMQGIEVIRQETKTSIAEVNHKIEALRLSTKADMAELKSDLIKWIVGVQTASIGTVIAGLAFIVTRLPG